MKVTYCILSLVVACIIGTFCFISSCPIGASGGIALSGTFSSQTFEITQGSSWDASDVNLVVFNNDDQSIGINLTSQCPAGVSLILSETSFELAPSSQKTISVVNIGVARDATPGEYEISIKAEAYSADTEGIQLLGSVAQTASLIISSEISVPTLISPANGATAAGTIMQGSSTALVSLIWEDMPQSTQYQFEMAYDSEFTSIADDGILADTQYSATLYLGEKYYWRVRAYSPTASQWSEVWSFTTPLGPASSKPVITYPGTADSQNDIPSTPTLTWTTTVEATGFELVVAANCDWSNPLINLTGSNALVGSSTAYSITQSLQQGTNYCWKVRAVNSDTDTMSPWSDTGTFTTVVAQASDASPGSSSTSWLIVGIGGGFALLLTIGIFGISRRIGKNRAANARIRKLRQQLDKWHAEGYDVSKLEDLFK